MQVLTLFAINSCQNWLCAFLIVSLENFVQQRTARSHSSVKTSRFLLKKTVRREAPYKFLMISVPELKFHYNLMHSVVSVN